MLKLPSADFVPKSSFLKFSMDPKRLGLIAGNGKFPILFAQKAKSQDIKVITAGVKGDTSWKVRFFSDKFKLFKAGDLKKIFLYFKENGITDVLMAGQVNPKHLFDTRLSMDEDFKRVFQTLKDRKADTIFLAIAEKLKEQGFKLIDSTFLLKDCLALKGTLTKRGPTLNELEDIEFGRDIAKAMGAIDVGQTVVIKDKAIVAIEAMEGTDKAILRGGKIAQKNAVVVKMSKPNQDFRFDVPVVGPKTIRNMVKAHASCLAVETGKTIMIDQEVVVKLANKNNVSILGI